MRRWCLGLLLGLLLCACQAKDSTPPATAASSPAGGLTQRLKQAVLSAGKTRVVAKGARPELVIRGDAISFEGKPLVLGGSIEQWKAIIGSAPRHMQEQKTVYVWDELGLEVQTSLDDPGTVAQLTVQLNAKPKDGYEGLVTQLPDGTPVRPVADLTPKKTFPGYLEMDGYGIDAATVFSDIRSSVDSSRGLKCGLRDCSHPHGSFGSQGGVHLRLTGTDENSTVQEFVVSRH
jgi:hypothetical protein